MPPSSEDRIVERIYAAVLDPSQWALVVGELGAMFGSASCLFVQNLGAPDIGDIIFHDISESAIDSYREHYCQVNPIVPALLASPDLHIAPHLQVVERPAWDRSEYFNDWYRPQRFHHSIGSPFRTGSGTRTFAVLFRDQGRGDYTDGEERAFARLLPHLKRGVELGHHFSVQRALASEAQRALGRAGVNCVALTRTGMIADLGPGAEQALAKAGARIDDGRIWLGTTERTSSLIQSVARVADSGVGESIALRPFLGSAPLKAELVPFTSSFIHLGSLGPKVLLLIQADDRDRGTNVQGIAEAFGLTGAETRLLSSLAQGESLPAYCQRLGLSRNTAKTQLAAIFQKTGTARQADLIRLAHRGAGSPMAHRLPVGRP
jgi:DNA-binding CsgD family transcriptional regulator